MDVIIWILLQLFFVAATTAQTLCEDDFLLLVGQKTQSDPIYFYKAELPATNIQNLTNLLVTPNINSYLDYNPLTHDIYYTDYLVYGDVTIPSILMSGLNSLTQTSVVHRNFQGGTGDEAQSLEEICPNKWENFGDFSYLVEETPMTQPNAVSYCELRGGQLTSITSYDENNYLHAKASSVTNSDIWIGLEDLNAPDDTYAWLDGAGILTDIFYTNWATNEPNNSGDEDCATMRRADGLWNDWYCTNGQPHVCKRLKGSSTNCPAGWQEFDTYCYQLFDLNSNFDAAIADCESRNAMLTSITSQEENDFIEALGVAFGVTEDFWIGYHDRNIENSFEWIDGAQQGVFSANWQNGNYPPLTSDDCVVLRQSDGYWRDLHCTNNQKPFVCKRPRDPEGPLRISPCDNKMYWESNDTIYQSDSGGTDVVPVVTGLNNTVDFQINAATQIAIVAHYDVTKDLVLTSYLTFVGLTDSTHGNQIKINSVRVTSLDVDWSDRKIYFATSDPLTIQCVDFEGVLVSDVTNQISGYDVTRGSLKIHGDYLYYIYYDTDCTSTLRRVLKVPPNNDPDNNAEEALLSGESFVRLSDLYAISCAATSPLSFMEPSAAVEECDQLDAVAYIQRTIVNDSNSDPNLDCPTISVTATPGTAEEEDYNLESSSVTFGPSEILREFPIGIVCDAIVGEGNETFTVDTLPASSSPFTVTIRDFTSSFLFEEAVYSVMEGTSHVAATILRQGYHGVEGHVYVTPTSSDSALPSHDFEASNVKVEFSVGQPDATVNINILDDDVLEDPETFTLELHSVYPLPQASIGIPNKSIVTITDDDFEIKLNETHYTVGEGAGSIKVPILRLGYVNGDDSVVLPVQTYENSRSAVDGVDFKLLQNSVTFSKGDAVKYVEIQIFDDDIGETNEAFRLVVTDPTKGVTVLLEVHVAIVDDDVAYQFSTSTFVTDEINELLRIPIVREGGTYIDEILYVTTEEETASAGEDFKDRGNVEVKFDPGDTTKFAFIDILDDKAGEGTETFSLKLIASNGVILDTAHVTILDDDPLPVAPGAQVYSFEVLSDVVSEADGYRRLGVIRTQFDNEGSVMFSTQSGTAEDLTDFIGVSEELVQFYPGQERVFTTRIQIIDDDEVEIDEIFIGRLSQPSDGTVSTQDAVVTIEDDDVSDEIEVIDSNGFNIGSGVLAAIIICTALTALIFLALGIFGCVMLFKKQATASGAATPAVQHGHHRPPFSYEMQSYYNNHYYR